jgi:hypothetical protein
MVSRTRHRLLLGWALGLLALGPVQAGTRTITCCEDGNGQRICSDVLPPVCYNRAYREISKQGTVKKVVPAPLSAEERARLEAEEHQRLALRDKAREQQRRDHALLQTYTSLADLEASRQRAMDGVERELAALRDKEGALVKKRGSLDEEAAALQNRPRPPELVAALRDSDGELLSLRSVIDVKQRELEAVKARYAEDRRRYVDLSAKGASGR